MKWDLAAFITALAVVAAGMFVVLAECVREFGIADVVAVVGMLAIVSYLGHEMWERAND
jgi:hypothetical protein